MCNNVKTFVGCGGPQQDGDFFSDPSQAVLPKVIQATNRDWVALKIDGRRSE